MRNRLILTSLVLLLAAGTRSTAQTSSDVFAFDCGTITPTSSGISTYQDFVHGFRFELPTGWLGENGMLSIDQGKSGTIFVEALFASKDAKEQLAKGTTATGTERIKDLEWSRLAFTDMRRGQEGYRLEHDEILVQVVASDDVKDKVIAPATAATVQQILATFVFTDNPYRLDRQLAGLKPGDKLGDLTVKRVVYGSGGFEHPYATVEFAGQLTLSGDVMLPSPTMLGGWGPYRMYPDDESGSMLPRLKCPVEVPEKPGVSRYALGLDNQQFTNQQFAQVPSISGPHAWYEALATVVVDHIRESFYNAAMAPQVSARLVKVVSKKDPQ